VRGGGAGFERVGGDRDYDFAGCYWDHGAGFAVITIFFLHLPNSRIEDHKICVIKESQERT
jgi:hypothetical protein